MKKIIYLVLIVIGFTLCKKETESPQKLFDPNQLSNLELDKIEAFWQDDTITHISGFVTATFDKDSGHLASVSYSASGKRSIAVSVFETKGIAINAMEFRIKNVSGVIDKGTTNELNGDWWYSDNGWGTALFNNKLNTIVELMVYKPISDSLQDNLYSTINTIADRIEELSE